MSARDLRLKMLRAVVTASWSPFLRRARAMWLPPKMPSLKRLRQRSWIGPETDALQILKDG
jgi:hypothetical protein